MTDDVKRSVLVVNTDEALFGKIAPLLDREEFEVSRFPRASMAFELISVIAFDVLIVRYPLPDIDALEFLGAVRGSNSACRRSPLLLLADPDRYDEAAELVGRGANRIVNVDESAERLQAGVASLLDVAQRYMVKVIVRLELHVDGRKELAIGKTENLSETGMLVVGGRSYPLGTTLSFEFFLEDDPQPVRGDCIVVRETTPGREAVAGVGVQFVSFERDSLKRLRRHLHEAWGEVEV